MAMEVTWELVLRTVRLASALSVLHSFSEPSALAETTSVGAPGMKHRAVTLHSYDTLFSGSPAHDY